VCDLVPASKPEPTGTPRSAGSSQGDGSCRRIGSQAERGQLSFRTPANAPHRTPN